MRIHKDGFIIFPARSPGGLTRYKPLWALYEMGLIQLGMVPPNSWLRMQGFTPLWTDPIV